MTIPVGLEKAQAASSPLVAGAQLGNLLITAARFVGDLGQKAFTINLVGAADGQKVATYDEVWLKERPPYSQKATTFEFGLVFRRHSNFPTVVGALPTPVALGVRGARHVKQKITDEATPKLDKAYKALHRKRPKFIIPVKVVATLVEMEVPVTKGGLGRQKWYHISSVRLENWTGRGHEGYLNKLNLSGELSFTVQANRRHAPTGSTVTISWDWHTNARYPFSGVSDRKGTWQLGIDSSGSKLVLSTDTPKYFRGGPVVRSRPSDEPLPAAVTDVRVTKKLEQKLEDGSELDHELAYSAVRRYVTTTYVIDKYDVEAALDLKRIFSRYSIDHWVVFLARAVPSWLNDKPKLSATVQEKYGRKLNADNVFTVISGVLKKRFESTDFGSYNVDMARAAAILRTTDSILGDLMQSDREPGRVTDEMRRYMKQGMIQAYHHIRGGATPDEIEAKVEELILRHGVTQAYCGRHLKYCKERSRLDAEFDTTDSKGKGKKSGDLQETEVVTWLLGRLERQFATLDRAYAGLRKSRVADLADRREKIEAFTVKAMKNAVRLLQIEPFRLKCEPNHWHAAQQAADAADIDKPHDYLETFVRKLVSLVLADQQ